MALFLIYITTLLCSQSPPGWSQSSPGWRSIVPVHSTRADVERVWGPSTYLCKCEYHFEDFNVDIRYSAGDCRSGRGAWDVPVDTVLWITVYPKPNPRLTDLEIDRDRFVVREGNHIEEFYYDDEEKGLTLAVYEGKVQSFIYGPTAKEKHLRCAK